MAQQRQAFAHRGEAVSVIPLGSADITSGDYVALSRASDPISIAVLGTEGRVSTVASAYECQWGIGIADTDFNTNAVGATLYAAPTVNQAVPVLRKGVVSLAIAQTSGKAGELVVISTATSGSQVFKINNFRRDVAVGVIYKDFSGATANDPQQVELFEKPMSGKDIYFALGNGVVEGCILKKHSVNGQASTQINAGATGEENYVRIKNKWFSVARVTDFSMSAVMAPGGQSAIRFYWVAIKVSTTGRAVDWTKETCTGPFSAFASWTNSGISAGMMVPKTWTSNMIPVGLVIAWSATGVTIGSDRILMLGPDQSLPNGTSFADHATWYL